MCVHPCMPRCTCVHGHAHVHIYMPAHITHMHRHCRQACVHMHTGTYTWTYIHTHTHVADCTCAHMCMRGLACTQPCTMCMHVCRHGCTHAHIPCYAASGKTHRGLLLGWGGGGTGGRGAMTATSQPHRRRGCVWTGAAGVRGEATAASVLITEPETANKCTTHSTRGGTE